MHWIHTAPLLGLAVQATGDDPHTDEPVQVGALSRHGRAAHTPPDMPLAVDLNSQPTQTEITRSWPWPLRRAGRDQGQSLPKVLQRTTQFLLEAAQHGQTVVCVDGHRTLELAFGGETSTARVLATVGSLGEGVEVSTGTIETLAGTRVGRMRLTLPSAAVADAMQRLRAAGVHVEEVAP